MKILVTGSNGFIGKYFCDLLDRSGMAVVRASRQVISGSVMVGDIDENTDWSAALEGVDAVVHLAARVHMMRETEADSLAAFRKVNVQGSVRLARMAAQAGVKRFVFVSSVKVNGEEHSSYTEKDTPAPKDPYGISKWEAEQALALIAAETGLELVVIRPPLVYGPGVKANFRNLIKLVSLGLPLPFNGVRNLRSFVYVGNLADAILMCVKHPKAAGETFLVSDGQDASTPDLIRMIAVALGKKPLLFSLPVGLFNLVFKLAGKSEEMVKLTGALCVDSSKIRNLLGWTPPFTLQKGLAETLRKDQPC